MQHRRWLRFEKFDRLRILFLGAEGFDGLQRGVDIALQRLQAVASIFQKKEKGSCPGFFGNRREQFDDRADTIPVSSIPAPA